jgi:hypothetical protein
MNKAQVLLSFYFSYLCSLTNQISIMKKSYLFASVLLCFSFHAQSQVVKKGDRLFGGSFSLSFANSNAPGAGYTNNTNVGLLPSFAWAIKENLTLGVKGNISYSRSSLVAPAPDKTIVSTFSGGPGIFLRKYKSLKNQFGIYFNNELNAFYALVKQKGGLFADPVKNNSWGANYSFNPGVFYRFSDSFFGEANIGGIYASYYKNDNGDNFGVGASFLQYFNLGINYVIGRKK